MKNKDFSKNLKKKDPFLKTLVFVVLVFFVFLTTIYIWNLWTTHQLIEDTIKSSSTGILNFKQTEVTSIILGESNERGSA